MEPEDEEIRERYNGHTVRLSLNRTVNPSPEYVPRSLEHSAPFVAPVAAISENFAAQVDRSCRSFGAYRWRTRKKPPRPDDDPDVVAF
jgi:hypothetical protein